MPEESKPQINAKTFQEPLAKLAETIAQKVMREGTKLMSAPNFVAEDLFMMMRQSIATYKLLFYLNADSRREQDCDWNTSYGIVTAPLVRSMIDCLYNITAVIQDPGVKGPAYRKSGFRRALIHIEEDEEKYRGSSQWESYNEDRRKVLIDFIRTSGFTEVDVKQSRFWPTLSVYLREDPTNPTQAFLKGVHLFGLATVFCSSARWI